MNQETYTRANQLQENIKSLKEKIKLVEDARNIELSRWEGSSEEPLTLNFPIYLPKDTNPIVTSFIEALIEDYKNKIEKYTKEFNEL